MLPELGTPLKTSSSCSPAAENLPAWSKRVHHRHSTNCWGELGADGWLWALPEPIVRSALTHLSPSSSFSSGHWLRPQRLKAAGKELQSNRPIHRVAVTIMSWRTLSQAFLTGYLVKQGNYLPVCPVYFQPLIYHTGMLHKIIECHRNLGAQGEMEKTGKYFWVLDVKVLTCPYSVMRTCRTSTSHKVTWVWVSYLFPFCYFYDIKWFYKD